VLTAIVRYRRERVNRLILCRSRNDAHAMPYVLYQRDDCHLCDLALEVLADAGMPAFDSVFIDGDEALEARYGHRVPVLRGENEDELDWPFDAAMVAAMLQRDRYES
jgi:Glutaredoxin-like domain (DUF836)